MKVTGVSGNGSSVWDLFDAGIGVCAGQTGDPLIYAANKPSLINTTGLDVSVPPGASVVSVPGVVAAGSDPQSGCQGSVWGVSNVQVTFST